MAPFLYTVGVLALTAGLVVFSYLDRVYRELGRVVSGRVREHLETFEAEIEPRLHLERRQGPLTFSMLARLWLVLVAALTARGVLFFVPGTWEAAVEMIFFLGAQVVIAMQFIPSLLIARASGAWVRPFVPLVRVFQILIWPVQAVLELAVSILHLSDEAESESAAEDQQQAIEALVDAATEEGIIEQDEARLIESVVEFGDKRVRDVMTPRPDVIAIRASATLEELGELVVDTKFSRVPVYDKSLDDIVGIVVARDMLEVSDREATHRTVRELMRPALFVPETKFGSALLKELQRKNQQMAIVIDEYGLMAGVVTVEDLVEEIVGEIGEEDRTPVPDVVREPGGALVIRGSVPVDKVGELLGVQLDADTQHSAATTIAGLLNGLAGHVPRNGEIIEADGVRFEVVESNQRKVLRVRARPTTPSATTSTSSSS
jgi:CBS domain containing-hemolysin-like protein